MSTDRPDAQVVADLAYAAGQAKSTGENGADRRFVVIPEGGKIEYIEPFRARPERITDTVFRTSTLSGFMDYLARFATVDTVVFVRDNLNIGGDMATAIVDYHAKESAQAGWRDHCATFSARYSDEFAQWHKNNKRLMPQQDFASHIEDLASTVVEPTAADMLELAARFEVKTNVNFVSGQRQSSGERKFTYEETIASKAGQVGEVTIPETIHIRVEIAEGLPAQDLSMRFFYRINEGDLSLGYKIMNLRDAERLAFGYVGDVIRARFPGNTFFGQRS